MTTITIQIIQQHLENNRIPYYTLSKIDPRMICLSEQALLPAIMVYNHETLAFQLVTNKIAKDYELSNPDTLNQLIKDINELHHL